MAGQQHEPELSIDEFPSDRSQLASMTPEERAAIYLNSIRRSMSFFVVLAVASIILAVIAVTKN